MLLQALRSSGASNVLMFFARLVGWRLARSTALLADAFDMLADATGYAVAFWVVGGDVGRQRFAAQWSGALLIALGLGVLGEVAHRWLVPARPEGWWIAAFASLSLLANGAVLWTLRAYKASAQLHLRAAWVDTRADVLVNAGVLLSGVLVALLGHGLIDLAVGALVAAFVVHEGWELWEESGRGQATQAPTERRSRRRRGSAWRKRVGQPDSAAARLWAPTRN